MEKSNEIQEKREYYVVKSNDLIQKSRFELSLMEQKTIAYICSMIKPTKSSYQLKYEFELRDYCRVCGIDASGQFYKEIKSTLKELRDKSTWVTLPDGTEELCGWLAKVRLNEKRGIAHIELDKTLVPYLFSLGELFTKYQLYNILAMKSAFSVRIYELMKSYQNLRKINISLSELKHKLNVDKVKSYENFKDFRRRVLDTALKEINELTDINVKYAVSEKKANKVVAVCFEITVKTPIERLCNADKVYSLLDNKSKPGANKKTTKVKAREEKKE